MSDDSSMVWLWKWSFKSGKDVYFDNNELEAMREHNRENGIDIDDLEKHSLTTIGFEVPQ